MLQVVGAGVGRTGTHSLKVALEQLLGGHVPSHGRGVRTSRRGPRLDRRRRRGPVDWGDLMKGYTAQVDWPGASFWPELSAANPDALVILSVREPDAWYTSCSNTIFAGHVRCWAVEGNEWMAAMARLIKGGSATSSTTATR